MNLAEIDETEIIIPEENMDPLFSDHVTTDEMLRLVRTVKIINQVATIKF